MPSHLKLNFSNASKNSQMQTSTSKYSQIQPNTSKYRHEQLIQIQIQDKFWSGIFRKNIVKVCFDSSEAVQISIQFDEYI